ncbi:MAG: DUF2798 domain-containing protein [Pseudoalteromonas tetraodonis]|nr:DUF2798 domain-containing protein [Pseudoalteromonas tetraodonis]
MNTPALINYVPVTLKKTPVIYKILVMVMMITLVGGFLTYIMTYTNVGITDHFYMDWFTSFLSAVLVMAPIGLAMTAFMNVFVTKLLTTASELNVI